MFKNNKWVFRKILGFFLKIAKWGKLALKCNWTSKNLQNVQKFGALKKKMGSFRTKTFFTEKLLKVANSLYIATEWIIFSKCSKFGFFQVKYKGFWKKLTFFKTAKDKKIVVGCNWFSKISQNVEKVASSWEKKIGFSKNNLEFS